jgi:hypothetical protein
MRRSFTEARHLCRVTWANQKQRAVCRVMVLRKRQRRE